VKRIVDEIGHSRTILYERFHEHVDMSVAAYMKQERLNAAKKLLVETSRPIEDFWTSDQRLATSGGSCDALTL